MSKPDPCETSAGADPGAGPIGLEGRYDAASTFSTGGSPRRSPERAVDERIREVLDALGLPHDGGALGRPDREREIREMLVASLRRNFAARDEDGARSYDRVARPEPAAASAGTDRVAPGSRGLGLVEAETLLARAELVLRLIDRLPAMLRYRPASAGDDAEPARDRIRSSLDKLLAPTSAASGRVLVEALAQIGAMLPDAGVRDTGRDAARIDQAMTQLGAGAEALRAELATLGTSSDEQELAYFGRAGRAVSVGQFARWAAELSASFASGDDLAATVRRDELGILHRELSDLAEMAEALDREATRPAPLRLVGARRRATELATLIADARARVAELIDDGEEASDPRW